MNSYLFNTSKHDVQRFFVGKLGHIVCHCFAVIKQNPFSPIIRLFIHAFRLGLFVSKQFPSDEVKQAAVFGVAAESIYRQHQQQENEHDDAHYPTFTQTRLTNCRKKRKRTIMFQRLNNNTNNILNVFRLALINCTRLRDGEVNMGRAGGAVVVYGKNFHLIVRVVLEIMQMDLAQVSRNLFLCPVLIFLVLLQIYDTLYC